MSALTGLIAAQAITRGAGAITQAQAIREQGREAGRTAAENARIAKLRAKDIERIGGKEARRTITRGRQLQGRQRAALAAQGIDPSTGSAREILEETQFLSELDAMTIEVNARRRAFGERVGAVRELTRGQFARAAAKSRAGSTLLTGAANVLGDVSTGLFLARSGSASASSTQST